MFHQKTINIWNRKEVTQRKGGGGGKEGGKFKGQKMRGQEVAFQRLRESQEK